ncbi:Nup133 N terminal like-domain-containing protein [Absidia repens]|uniref:Nup133 N terminal like-domain-containing protein n=1 Tax=Absidia repens TaxID=90262 RepID=A0A1X2HX79_9FUNG|nr:Nup133 N terminal like-domain-containing protein [Absidia repens]
MIGDEIRSQIDANLQQDQKRIEFNAFLKDTTIDQYCSSQTTLEQAFKIDSTSQLPKHLVAILQDRRNTSATGILPELQRIWIASGTMIYFWDYVKRTSFTYETNDKVHQVGLVKPKSGLFTSSIDWILVVNTTRYITLSGVIIGDDNSMKLDNSQRRSIPSDEVKMKSIIGTHNARILMLGADDGHIYELVYKADSSQDRLVCQTDHGLHTYFGFLPLSSLFKSVLDVKIKSIAMDHQRNVLYALAENSTIQIICFDDGDVTFKFGITLTDINDQFVSLLFAASKADPMKMPSSSTLNIVGSPLAPKAFDIISVHPVPKQQHTTTRDIAFYAVTSHGCRLYFTSNEPNSIITEKSTFTLNHVRLVPHENDQSSVIHLSSERLESAYQMQHGGVFMAPIHGKTKNKLWMTSYQEQHHQENGDIKIEETSDVMEYESAIVVIGQHINNSTSSTFYERTDTSINMPCSQFIVMTNNGNIVTYKKQRPVDLVYQCITTNNQDDINSLLVLALQRFGSVETYTMLLDILSTSPTHLTQQHLLFSLAKHHPEQFNQALALIYTRIVARVWQKNILMGDDKDDLYDLLGDCKDRLQQVYILVNTSCCSKFAGNMLELFHSSIQVISFVTLLKKKHMFTSEPCDAICFADLITTPYGHTVLEKLVNKAIHYFASTGQDQGMMISAFLVEHCPTLFGDAHHLALFEGDEYLATGKYLGSTGQQQTSYFEKSLDKYMDGIDYLQPDARTRICETYKELGYYQGVVTFSVHAAAHHYPTETTERMSPAMTGCIAVDSTPPTTMTVDDIDPILALLDHVNNQTDDGLVSVIRMTLPIYSHNKALHYAIYTWLMDHDKLPLLFDEEKTNDVRTTQHLIQFLEHDYENKPVGMDALYKYYDHRGDKEKTITCLTTLAMDIRGSDVSLKQRIQYLHLALQKIDQTNQQQQQRRLTLYYETALVQQTILNRLVQMQVEVDDRLVSSLLGVEDLRKDYAEKYGLWDQVLLLMCLSGKEEGSEYTFDYAAMKMAWACFLDTQHDLTTLRSQLVTLGTKLYPSITTFPVYLIVFLLEPYSLTLDAKKGFVVDLLLEIGVPSAVLEDAYDFILYNKLSTSDNGHLQEQLDYLKISSS